MRLAVTDTNQTQLLKCSIILFFTFVFNLLTSPAYALNIGAETTGVAVSVSKECSRQCESSFCSVPPLLRYGKYCGLLYSGCPGEKPCDGLDACCMSHDQCVTAKNSEFFLYILCLLNRIWI
ncbi:phospholipase A2-alpha-like [Vicia villosa]|uniref:phospholipase A2-alpha-like n=1 Tax=Vicia villosa TaxID=3911 RepID=UPI00273C38AA|nr:phospholipase A2-alpha-like [Vicia villosa]